MFFIFFLRGLLLWASSNGEVQRGGGPVKGAWRAVCGPRAVVWGPLMYVVLCVCVCVCACLYPCVPAYVCVCVCVLYSPYLCVSLHITAALPHYP